MINDQLSLDFAGASEGMLPTTSCSLPSSSGISFLLGSTLDDRQPVRLLPRRRLTTAIFPIVSRATGATSGSDDLGGSVVGERFGKAHGQTIHGKNKSAMPKIILAIRRQCRQSLRMSNTNRTALENAIAPAINITGTWTGNDGKTYRSFRYWLNEGWSQSFVQVQEITGWVTLY